MEQSGMKPNGSRESITRTLNIHNSGDIAMGSPSMPGMTCLKCVLPQPSEAIHLLSTTSYWAKHNKIEISPFSFIKNNKQLSFPTWSGIQKRWFKLDPQSSWGWQFRK